MKIYKQALLYNFCQSRVSYRSEKERKKEIENVNDPSEEMSKQNNKHSTVILHSLVVTIRIGFDHVGEVTHF